MIRFKNLKESRKLGFFLDSTLHSYSQILFSKNRMLGCVILLASFAHPFAGMNGLIGVLFTNLFAYRLGLSRREIKVGLLGFNGALFGMALSLYAGINNIQIVFFVILFSVLLIALKALTASFFQKYSLPFLSTPFVLLTWIIILTGTVDIQNPEYLSEVQFEGYTFLHFIKIFLKNIGHVIFSPYEITGVLILAGLLLFSRTMFFIAILSFSVIAGFSFIFPQYNEYVANNGYNAILVSIAIGGIFFVPGPKSLSMALIASIFTVMIGDIISNSVFFSTHHIPALTAPFNIITILFIYSMQQNAGETGLYRIFIPDAPEINYKRFLREHDRYGKVDRGLLLPVMGWWFVSQGIDGRHTHKGIFKWGIDFIVTDKGGKPYRDTGNELSEHYCYNKPVISPGDGVIYSVENTTPDNPVTKTNLDYSWGNYVIVQHNPSLFSVLCHFGQRQTAVNISDIVKKGENIGNVGSSGLAPYPHLHLQFQSSGSIGEPTIPVHFSDYLIKDGNYYEYVPLGIPEERQVVSNLPTDTLIKNAVGFDLGQTTHYELRRNGKIYQEDWKCDMDSHGILFIESSLHKDRLFFLKNEKSILFHEYIGRKDSGLYILSLALDKIPFYANERLRWHKKIPYVDILTGIKSLLWESVRPYINSNDIIASHTFKVVDSRFVLSSVLKNGKRCIANRFIVFDNGLFELIYKTEGNEISLKRAAGPQCIQSALSDTACPSSSDFHNKLPAASRQGINPLETK